MKKLIISLSLLLLTACTIVRVYKTDSMRAKVDGYITSLETNSKKVKNDLGQKKVILKELKSAKVAKKKSLLKILNKNYSSCQKIYKKFNRDIVSFKSEYNSLKLWEKKEIKSNEPEFKNVQSFIDDIPKHNETMNTTAEKYEKTCSLFAQTLQKRQIAYVEASKLKSQFEGALKQLSDSQASAKSQIDQVKEKVLSSDHQKKQDLLNGINELEKVLLAISESKDPILKAVNNFHKRHGKSNKILHGPGTQVHNDLELIKSVKGNLENQINAFNKKAAELRAIAEGK